MTSSLIVFILLGGAVILWILAFIAWADRKASAMDVYWAAGAAVLSCIALPLFAQFNPPTDALTSCVVALCSFGGLLCTIQLILVAIATSAAAYEFWIPTSSIGYTGAGTAATDRIGGSIFTFVAVIVTGFALVSTWFTLESAWKLVTGKPWYRVYAAAKQYDADVGETFLAENSPMYSIYLPAILLQQTDLDAILKDVNDANANMKLKIHVGSIVGTIEEDRGEFMDRIVIYKEVDAPGSTKVLNTRAIRFRNKYDPSLLEKIALGIDTLRKGMKSSGNNVSPARPAQLGKLGFPPSTAVPSIGQSGIIKAGP